MPGYLLDTQIISYWFDRNSPEHSVVQVAAEARQGDSPLYVSAISVGEIAYGHAVNPIGTGQKRNDFVRFVREQIPQVLGVSRHTAEPYGEIRARLFETFAPKSKKSRAKRAEELCDPTTGRELGIDENDLWLVAQAAERNLVLVTHDKLVHIRDTLRELSLGVQVEDWATDDGAVG